MYGVRVVCHNELPWHKVPWVCTPTEIRQPTELDFIWLGLTHTQEES